MWLKIKQEGQTAAFGTHVSTYQGSGRFGIAWFLSPDRQFLTRLKGSATPASPRPLATWRVSAPGAPGDQEATKPPNRSLDFAREIVRHLRAFCPVWTESLVKPRVRLKFRGRVGCGEFNISSTVFCVANHACWVLPLGSNMRSPELRCVCRLRLNHKSVPQSRTGWGQKYEPRVVLCFFLPPPPVPSFFFV